MCAHCRKVTELVARATRRLLLIVDGSYAAGRGGAGLVLVADHAGGMAVAECSCLFSCRGPDEAEFQAIVRGRRWAPGVPVLSDARGAIQRAHRAGMLEVRYIERGDRAPNHNRAHNLSVEGRIEAVPWGTRAATR